MLNGISQALGSAICRPSPPASGSSTQGDLAAESPCQYEAAKHSDLDCTKAGQAVLPLVSAADAAASTEVWPLSRFRERPRSSSVLRRAPSVPVVAAGAAPAGRGACALAASHPGDATKKELLAFASGEGQTPQAVSLRSTSLREPRRGHAPRQRSKTRKENLDPNAKHQLLAAKDPEVPARRAPPAPSTRPAANLLGPTPACARHGNTLSRRDIYIDPEFEEGAQPMCMGLQSAACLDSRCSDELDGSWSEYAPTSPGSPAADRQAISSLCELVEAGHGAAVALLESRLRCLHQTLHSTPRGHVLALEPEDSPPRDGPDGLDNPGGPSPCGNTCG